MSRRATSRLFSLGRDLEPQHSSDPVVRELVSALGSLQVAPPLRSAFRDELRTQLVAVTPRLVAEGAGLVAEGAGVVTDAPVRSLAEARTQSRLRMRHVGRVAVGLAAVFVLLLGLGVWLSSRALPGDALYGLKRTKEAAQLHFLHGTDKGKKYLQLASTRADEVSGLVSRAGAIGGIRFVAGGISQHTTELIDSTLDAADSEVGSASTIFIKAASDQRQPGPLQILIDWSPSQTAKLRAIAARLPDGTAKQRLAAAIATVRAAQSRAAALAPFARCGCLTTLKPGQLPGRPGGNTSGPGSPSGSGSGSGGSQPGHSGSTLPTSGLPTLPTSGLPTLPTSGLPTLPTRLPTTHLPTSGLPTHVPTSSLPTSSLPTSSLPSWPTSWPTWPTWSTTFFPGSSTPDTPSAAATSGIDPSGTDPSGTDPSGSNGPTIDPSTPGGTVSGSPVTLTGDSRRAVPNPAAVAPRPAQQPRPGRPAPERPTAPLPPAVAPTTLTTLDTRWHAMVMPWLVSQTASVPSAT